MAKKDRKPPIKQIGAEKRLCHLTYSQIADWAGLAPRSVIQYASRGEFNPNNLESVLQWVNGRRQRLSLPLIGAPPDPTALPAIRPVIPTGQGHEEPEEGDSEQKPRENQGETDSAVSHFPSVQLGHTPNVYNPETGEFNA